MPDSIIKLEWCDKLHCSKIAQHVVHDYHNGTQMLCDDHHEAWDTKAFIDGFDYISKPVRHIIIGTE